MFCVPLVASLVELATGSCCASPWSWAPSPTADSAPAPRPRPPRRSWRCRPRPSRSLLEPTQEPDWLWGLVTIVAGVGRADTVRPDPSPARGGRTRLHREAARRSVPGAAISLAPSLGTPISDTEFEFAEHEPCDPKSDPKRFLLSCFRSPGRPFAVSLRTHAAVIDREQRSSRCPGRCAARPRLASRAGHRRMRTPADANDACRLLTDAAWGGEADG
jgi:hypothetical protein